MSPKNIVTIAFICLLLIFGTQAYLVYDYYHTTRDGLVRESDAILDEVFKLDLNNRNKMSRDKLGGANYHHTDTIAPPPSVRNAKNSEKPVASFNFDKMNVDKSDFMNLLNIALHDVVSKTVPLSISRVDSVAGIVLKSKKIHSAYYLSICNPVTDSVLEVSKKQYLNAWFKVNSKYLPLDFGKKKALRLTLVNPFSLIFKRMALMLASSLILAFMCMLAFRYLLIVLSRQKKLVAFKNDFLSNIAHELRRPVAALSLNLEALAMPSVVAGSRPYEQLLARSVNATNEMNDTITMLLTLAREEEGLLTLRKSRVLLPDMLEELKERFEASASKPVDIMLQCSAQNPAINADEQLLKQCFANLIDNAVKYSDGEASIVVDIAQTNHGIAVRITDKGRGIPADQLSGIFEKYRRVHPSELRIAGFGIGLSYVKTVVDKHGGSIEATSTPGAGSEFIVQLPWT